MTMKHQSQFMFMVIQMFYADLGVKNVLLIWWIFHFLEIYLHLYLYIWIYLNATRHFEEFNGYSSTRYPYQEKPRQAIIKPRRPSHSIINYFCSQVFCISDDDDDCIFNYVQPVYVSTKYSDLLNHIQNSHKLATVWGPVVIH